MTAGDWDDADYGREDGRADARAGREPNAIIRAGVREGDPYSVAYLEAYDAALAELAPDNVRPVSS